MRAPKPYLITRVSHMIYGQAPLIKKLYKRHDLDVSCFYDTVEIHFNNLNNDFLSDCTLLHSGISGGGYGGGARYRAPNGMPFTVQWDCKKSHWNYKVRFEARFYLKTFFELEDFMCSLVDGFDQINHQVNRLDLGFALHESEINAPLLHYCTQIKWNRRKSYYRNDQFDLTRGDITGLHSRGQGLRTSMYAEKAKPGRRRSKRTWEVKIEFQAKKPSLETKGIFSIYDLHKVEQTNLLDRLKFHNPLWIAPQNKQRLKQFRRFQLAVLAKGFTHARISLNKHDNFKRDYAKMIIPLQLRRGKKDLGEFLKEKWISWHSGWLGKNKKKKQRI